MCAIALRSGLTIDKTRPPWRTQMNDIGFPVADQADFRTALGRLFARLDETGEAEVDQSADRLLDPGNRWNLLLNATSTSRSATSGAIGTPV